jgi:cytochrome c biogenesis protein CcmG, thiol:disulfide interchange protein DsbE
VSRYFVLGGFLLLMGVFAVVLSKMGSGEYNPRDIPTEFIGKTAPEINVPDLYNPEEMVTTISMRGRVWLFNIWGTWCPECWREHEYLNQLAKSGVPIVGLNWRDERQEAQAMINRLGNPFISIGYDPDSQVAINWGVYGAPETFLINEQGQIVAKHAGGITPKVWQKKFKKYFEKSASESSSNQQNEVKS